MRRKEIKKLFRCATWERSCEQRKQRGRRVRLQVNKMQDIPLHKVTCQIYIFWIYLNTSYLTCNRLLLLKNW